MTHSLKAFTFAKLNESEEYPAEDLKKWVSWHKIEDIIRAHGTSHMDSAILSLTTVAAGIDGFLSNDRDLLTSALNGSLPPTVRVYTFLEDYSTEKK